MDEEHRLLRLLRLDFREIGLSRLHAHWAHWAHANVPRSIWCEWLWPRIPPASNPSGISLGCFAVDCEPSRGNHAHLLI